MTEYSYLQLLFFLLPAVIVGVIAFYFFNLHTRNEEQRRKFLLHREAQKHAFPIRMQAYERMTLFLERIAPGNLLVRIKPYKGQKEDYAALLTRTIEQEFEHNLAQQIYVSEECWNVIKASKNATINNIRKTAAREEIKTADELRKHILNSLLEQQPPSDTALAYIKKEVKSLW
jgi:maltodextrin utilization protein YvdJ